MFDFKPIPIDCLYKEKIRKCKIYDKFEKGVWENPEFVNNYKRHYYETNKERFKLIRKMKRENK